MAAPPDKTLTSLSGHWTLNKALSSPSSLSQILAIQGTSTFLRHAISSATITIEISQPSANRYHIRQTAISASIPGTTEEYVLDDTWGTNHDPFFGDVRGRSRWIGVGEARKNYPELRGEWEEGNNDDGQVVLAEGGKPDGEWKAIRIWGFERIKGERKYTQRVKVWNKAGENVKVIMVYDFVGK